jgi:hypothetical protein
VPGTVGATLVAALLACSSLLRVRADEGFADVAVSPHTHSRPTLVYQILLTTSGRPFKHSLRRVVVAGKYGSHILVFLDKSIPLLSVGLSFGLGELVGVSSALFASSVLACRTYIAGAKACVT